jgi:hypothetical protein
MIIGNGCGPTIDPIAKNVFFGSDAKQLIAASTASFKVFAQALTGVTFAQSIFIRFTFGASFMISTSHIKISQSIQTNAAAAAKATQCCQAHVSAITFFFHILLASKHSHNV